jgi:carbon monoxide dehydrogenase subunit G
MELTNDFTVDVPVDQAWEVLTDLERIAPCMPGAELRDIEGDDYHGVVKVKVGPITAEYRGKVTFVERDEGAHRAVLRAQGREVRGQGQANATITATLAEADASTRVSVVTDLNITGRVAQLGRGVLADVSNKLMSEFVDSLEATLLPAPPHEHEDPGPVAEGDGKVTAAADGPVTTSASNGAGDERHPVREARRPELQPVNLVRVAGPSVIKRVVPLVAMVGLAVIYVLWRGRRQEAAETVDLYV